MHQGFSACELQEASFRNLAPADVTVNTCLFHRYYFLVLGKIPELKAEVDVYPAISYMSDGLEADLNLMVWVELKVSRIYMPMYDA